VPEFAGEPSVAITHGVDMPLIGLGVWQLELGRETYDAVRAALDAGYRHIDTAAGYRNEASVGEAIRDSGLPRKAVFVTTKLRASEEPEAGLARSLDRLGLEWVDLYLIHSPRGGSGRHWPVLEDQHRRGLARAIGVSNWSGRGLRDLVADAAIPPAVNQIDFSPFSYSRATVDAHRELGVVLEGYSPLARGRGLSDPLVAAIADRHRRSPAQVLIRWSIQHGVPAIPRSKDPGRIAANRDVFDFSLHDEEMATLDALGY
jgi:diketogulonate reductase-like aldo/keto reductase